MLAWTHLPVRKAKPTARDIRSFKDVLLTTGIRAPSGDRRSGVRLSRAGGEYEEQRQNSAPSFCFALAWDVHATSDNEMGDLDCEKECVDLPHTGHCGHAWCVLSLFVSCACI